MIKRRLFQGKPYLRVHILSKFPTRPIAGTASDMASDSVRGRGKVCEANLENKSKWGMEALIIFEALAKIDMYFTY